MQVKEIKAALENLDDFNDDDDDDNGKLSSAACYLYIHIYIYIIFCMEEPKARVLHFMK